MKERARQPGKPESGPSTEDNSLFISAAAVLRSSAEGRLPTLLDVRSTQDFNTFRIPGSLSVPFSAVWTKGFFRSRRVVLVHSGYRCELLMKACRGLRAAGFDVAILAGGLPQWRRSGGPLEGDAVAIQEMTRVSPNIFYEAQRDGSWIVIDTSANAGSGRSLLPQSRSLPSTADPSVFQAELAKITGGDNGNPCLRVLLVSEHGEYPEELLRAVDRTVSVNVFRLAGGLAAYRDYLNLQTKMSQPKPPDQPKWKRCSSSP
jgi:rhodanese-related sulfurtransferase